MPVIAFEKQSFLWYKKNQFPILCLLISSLLFFPATFEGSIHGAFIFGVGSLSLLGWLANSSSVVHQARHPLFWPLLVFVLVGLLSTLLSSNLAASINGLSRDITQVMLFILAAMGSKKTASVIRGLKIIIVVGLILACYGIFQYMIGLQLTAQDLVQAEDLTQPLSTMIGALLNSNRAFSLFAYPNLFGGFLVLLLPLVLIMIHGDEKRNRWIWIIALVIVLAALFSSGSFGSWLAALTGGLLFYSLYPMSWKMKKRWLLIGLIIGIAGLMLLLAERSIDALWFSVKGRMTNWASVFLMLKEDWLIGVGPGRFGQAFSQLQPDHGHYMRFAHQLLLQQLAEKGLLGLISFLWLLGSGFNYLIKLKMKFVEDKQSIIIIGLSASVVASLAHAMIDIDADYLKTSMLIWLMAGLLLAMATAGHYKLPAVNRDQQWWFKPDMIYFGLLITASVIMLWKGGKSLVVEGGMMIIITTIIGLSLYLIKYHQLEVANYWKQLPFRKGWGLLLIWTIISIASSVHPWLGLASLWLFLSGLIVALIMFFYAKFDKSIYLLISLTTTLLAGLTIIDWLLHPGQRVSGGWPTSNLTAAYLAAGLMINLANALMGSLHHWAKKRSWLASGLLIVALLCTGSFSGLINCLIGLAVILIWAYQHKRLSRTTVLVISLTLLLLVFILPFKTGERLKAIKHYQGQVYERVELIKSSWKMFQDHLITGIGPGHFSQTFESYKFPNIRGLAKYGRRANFVHNEPIQLAVMLGLPGLLITGWLVICLILRFLKFWRLRAYHDHHLLIIVGWAILFGGLAQSLVDFNWHLPMLFFMYMILVGILSRPPNEVYPHQAKLLNKNTVELPLRSSVGQLLLILLMLTTIIIVNRPIISRYFITLGEAHYYKKHLKASAIAFEQALSLTPLSAKAYDKLGLVQQDLYSVYQDTQWFNLSEWAFIKSIQMNPGPGVTYRHLARLYHQRALQSKNQPKMPWFKKAEQTYSRAIKAAPKHAFYYFEYANVLRDAGKLIAAKEMWEKALAIEPYYAAAASNLGVACELLKLDQDAEKAYRQALSAKQFQNEIQNKLEIELFSLNWAIVHYNLGALLERQGKHAEAKQEYREALTLEPENQLALERLIKIEKNYQ